MLRGKTKELNSQNSTTTKIGSSLWGVINHVPFPQDVVKKIENVQTGSGDRPVQKVEISQSGVMDVPVPFEVTKEGVVA